MIPPGGGFGRDTNCSLGLAGRNILFVGVSGAFGYCILTLNQETNVSPCFLSKDGGAKIPHFTFSVVGCVPRLVRSDINGVRLGLSSYLPVGNRIKFWETPTSSHSTHQNMRLNHGTNSLVKTLLVAFDEGGRVLCPAPLKTDAEPRAVQFAGPIRLL